MPSTGNPFLNFLIWLVIIIAAVIIIRLVFDALDDDGAAGAFLDPFVMEAIGG
jgi:hypothetical protein